MVREAIAVADEKYKEVLHNAAAESAADKALIQGLQQKYHEIETELLEALNDVEQVRLGGYSLLHRLEEELDELRMSLAESELDSESALEELERAHEVECAKLRSERDEAIERTKKLEVLRARLMKETKVAAASLHSTPSTQSQESKTSTRSDEAATSTRSVKFASECTVDAASSESLTEKIAAPAVTKEIESTGDIQGGSLNHMNPYAIAPVRGSNARGRRHSQAFSSSGKENTGGLPVNKMRKRSSMLPGGSISKVTWQLGRIWNSQTRSTEDPFIHAKTTFQDWRTEKFDSPGSENAQHYHRSIERSSGGEGI
jgi:DNA-directed RNA polymerase subunit L